MEVPLFAAATARRSAIRQWAAAVILVCCPAAPAQEPVESETPAAVSVWVAGDGVRVNPETGRYFEDRVDIHADYPTGDYQSRNAIWDAAKARISLHAARNEFVSFQIIVDCDRPIYQPDDRGYVS